MTGTVDVEVVPPSAVPPRRRGRRGFGGLAAVITVAAVAIVVVVIGSGASDRPDARVAVVDQRTGEPLVAVDARIGSTFTLQHTHSVTKRLVVETFSIQEGPVIALEELWFDEPGPNLPAGPEPLGDGTTTFLHEDGAFRVLHHSHPIGTVPLLTGSAAVDHVLDFPSGERVRLLDVTTPGTPIELQAR